MLLTVSPGCRWEEMEERKKKKRGERIMMEVKDEAGGC